MVSTEKPSSPSGRAAFSIPAVGERAMECRGCPECVQRREAGFDDRFACGLSGAEVRPAPTDRAVASAIRDGEAPGLVCPRNLTRGDVTDAMAQGVLLRADQIGACNRLLSYYPAETRRELRWLLATAQA